MAIIVTIGICVLLKRIPEMAAVVAAMQVCINPRLDIAEPAMPPKGERAPAVACGKMKDNAAI